MPTCCPDCAPAPAGPGLRPSPRPRLRLAAARNRQLRAGARVYGSVRGCDEVRSATVEPDRLGTRRSLYRTQPLGQAEAADARALARSREQLEPHSLEYLWQTMFLGDLLNMRGRWDETEVLFPGRPQGTARTGRADSPEDHLHGALPGPDRTGTWRSATRVATAAAKPCANACKSMAKATSGRSAMNRVGQAYIALNWRPREGIAILGTRSTSPRARPAPAALRAADHRQPRPRRDGPSAPSTGPRRTWRKASRPRMPTCPPTTYVAACSNAASASCARAADRRGKRSRITPTPNACSPASARSPVGAGSQARIAKLQAGKPGVVVAKG